MKVVLAGQEFKSKNALRQTVAAILRSTPPNTELRDHDLELLGALLQHHCDAQQKIGAGVRSIWVRTLVGSSSGFVVQRVDGTETDFSYVWCLKCLGHANPYDDAPEAAFRIAILDQKNAARDLAFADALLISCPITGEMISRAESCVHHDPEFAEIVAAFLAAQKLNRTDVKIEAGDNVTMNRLADLRLERTWQEYHRAVARLIVMSPEGHKKMHAQRKPLP